MKWSRNLDIEISRYILKNLIKLITLDKLENMDGTKPSWFDGSY